MEQNKIIHDAVELTRKFFRENRTSSYKFRIEQLENIEKTILKFQPAIEKALKVDLNKSAFESYMCEIGLVLDEIKFIKKRLRKWMKPKKMIAGLTQQPGSLKINFNPFGTVLVMSPWNYPILLTLSPIVGAIAAGNTVVVKPSAYAAETASVIQKICQEAFPKGLCEVIIGGREENNALLEEKFDYIFFTGSPFVGHMVMEKAAKHLTPFTLELGGKSPCVIDATCDMKHVAKRIAFAKFVNAGQTCVAPDYVIVEETVKDEFINYLIKEFSEITSNEVYFKQNFPKIINQKHFERLAGILSETPALQGGKLHHETLQIEPAIVIDPDLSTEVMREEIFGPILPIISMNNWKEASEFIKDRPRPLALYLFTNDKAVMEYYENNVSYGGGCINDCLIHLSCPKAPFGGIGNSGMGQYHGYDSFLTFSHKKTVVKKAWFGDISLRYHPYTEKKFKFLMKMIG